jgi:hypothetical protein
MPVASGLVVVAIGAILAFAVHGGPSSVSLTAVGVILMIVGTVGFATGLYRERWRRHIVEDSLESGQVPPIDMDDEGLVVEPINPDDEHEVVVRRHLAEPREIVVHPSEHERRSGHGDRTYLDQRPPD